MPLLAGLLHPCQQPAERSAASWPARMRRRIPWNFLTPTTRAVMAIVAYIASCAPISVATAGALRDRTTEDVDNDTEQVATTRAAQA